MSNTIRVLLGVALCVLVFTPSCKKAAPKREATAAEIDAAIWESYRSHYEVTLPVMLKAAEGNVRKLGEVWKLANTYKLSVIAAQADQRLESLIFPRTKYASRKKHIDTLLKKVPEGTHTAAKLRALRNTLPEK